MERNKHRLNTNKSQDAVNEDGIEHLPLYSDSKYLPYNDIIRIINENEVFNYERRKCKKFRIVTTINPLISNPLFNVSGDNSWETFNSALFRDRSYPPNGVSLNEEDDLTYFESIEHHLKEKGGWFGYYNPKINETNRFKFQNMIPGQAELDVITSNGNNWDITYTYPSGTLSTGLTMGGLDIVDKKEVIVSGKKMVAIGVGYKHNLVLGDYVRLTNIGVDGDYEVKRLGLDNGDLQSNYFVIDKKINDLIFDKPKFKKIVNGVECLYYFRTFTKLKTVDGELISGSDLDIYKIAFSKNVFGDSMTQVATKNDIDVEGLFDNLGRPVTEIYLTIMKKVNHGFSKVSSGLLLNDVGGLDKNHKVPDIKRIHNGGEIPFKSSDYLNEMVTIDDDNFIGDLVEYNSNTLLETVLGEVHHRFNTTNRENGKQIQTVVQNERTSSESLSTSTQTSDTSTTITQTSDISDIVANLNTLDMQMGTGDTGGSTYKSYEPEDTTRTRTDRLRVIDTTDGGGSGFEYVKVNLRYSLYLSDVCNATSIIKYANSSRFDVMSILVNDVNGYSKSAPGYYSNGYIVKYWDGSRFTTNTVCDSSTNTNPDTTNSITKTLDLGSRQEGYYYKPFHKITLKRFSSYVEYGDENTAGIPDYARPLEGGKFAWRDIMDIGGELDYPFLNGVHHIYFENILSLKRQDPFSKIGLRTTGEVGDIKGNELSDKHKIKRTGDVC